MSLDSQLLYASIELSAERNQIINTVVDFAVAYKHGNPNPIGPIMDALDAYTKAVVERISVSATI